MPETKVREVTVNWRRSSRSMSDGNCVEVGNVHCAIAVRDTVDRAGCELRYPAKAWQVFVGRVKDGTLNL